MRQLFPALSMALVMCASASVAEPAPSSELRPAAEAPEPTEVRNLRLDVHVIDQEVDSVFFSARWVPPARGRLQTPITGYAVEVWRSDDGIVNPEGETDTLVVSRIEPDDARGIQTGVPFSCTTPSWWYAARVRALGDFSSPAPWAQTDPIEIACDDSPPGPPTVELDTIPPDTTLLLGLLVEEPDTISFEEPWVLEVGESRQACGFMLAGGEVLFRSHVDCVTDRAFGVASSDVFVLPMDWCSSDPSVVQIDGETTPCGEGGEPSFRLDLLRPLEIRVFGVPVV